LDFTLGFKPNPKPSILTLDPFVNSEGVRQQQKLSLFTSGSKVQLRFMGGFIGGSKGKMLHCLQQLGPTTRHGCIAFKNLAQEQGLVFVATLLGTMPKRVGS
jgi:hypothetical protein